MKEISNIDDVTCYEAAEQDQNDSELLDTHVSPMIWWSCVADQDHPGPRHAREIRHVESPRLLCPGECNTNHSCQFAFFSSYNAFQRDPSSQRPRRMCNRASFRANAVKIGEDNRTSNAAMCCLVYLGLSVPTKKGLARLLVPRPSFSKPDRSGPPKDPTAECLRTVRVRSQNTRTSVCQTAT